MGWGIALPLGLALAFHHASKKWKTIGLGLSVCLTVLALSELTFHVVPYPPFQSPYADLVGWDKLHEEVAQWKTIQDPFVIAVANWSMGSRANFYFSDIAPVYVLDERYDQFDLWEKETPTGKKVLLLSWKGYDFSPGLHCEKIEEIGTRTFSEHDQPINEVHLSWCLNLVARPLPNHE